jgi:hypothetical protein
LAVLSSPTPCSSPRRLGLVLVLGLGLGYGLGIGLRLGSEP